MSKTKDGMVRLYARNAGYVELVRHEIGDRPVYVLGESFSGPIAVLIATRLREQVLGIVLAATFVKNPWPQWLIRRSARVDPRATPRNIRDAILMGPYGDQELQSKVDDIVRTLSRPVRAARLRAVAECCPKCAARAGIPRRQAIQ